MTETRSAAADRSKILGVVKADDASVDVWSRSTRICGLPRTPSNERTAETAAVRITVWIDRTARRGSRRPISGRVAAAAVEQANAGAALAVDREYLPTLGPQKYKPVETYPKRRRTCRSPIAREAVDERSKRPRRRGSSAPVFIRRGRPVADGDQKRQLSLRRGTTASLGMTARTREGGGSGYFLRSQVDVRRLDVARIAREAIRRARTPAMRGRSSRRVPGHPRAAGGGGHHAGSSAGFDARAAEEGRSPFSAAGGRTRVGEKIFDERISVLSDPWTGASRVARPRRQSLPAQVVISCGTACSRT